MWISSWQTWRGIKVGFDEVGASVGADINVDVDGDVVDNVDGDDDTITNVDDHVDVDLEQRTKLRKCLIKNKGSKLI